MDNLIQRKGNAGISQSTEEVKEIAEIQAKMLLARNFPRDVDFCLEMIKHECRNRALAESAIYEFPRGDSVVRGASIRLVECVARHWGNIISGVKELGTVGNRATVKAYCWDLETNFFDEKVFEVEYVRSTKRGSYELTDPRDRYEMMANMGARRKRACMQAVIPQFVIDEAMAECRETLEKDVSAQNLDETKNKMLAAFVSAADWITPEHLGAVCGKDFEHISAKDIVKLRSLYNAIKDGFVKPEKAFGRETEPEKPSIEENDELNSLNSMLAGDKNDSER